MPANIARASIVAELRARAKSLGLDAFGIAAADARPDVPEKLARALEAAFGAIDAATRTEVVVPPRRVVHESFPLLLAAGAAALALALFGASRVGAREVWP